MEIEDLCSESTKNEQLPPASSSILPSDSASQVSSRRSRGSSLRSSVSSLRLQEEQKQAELTARKEALINKQKLEQAKLNLQQQEEQLNIETDIAVSQARSKVLDQYDNNSVKSLSNVSKVNQQVTDNEKAIFNNGKGNHTGTNNDTGINIQSPLWASTVQESAPNYFMGSYNNTGNQNFTPLTGNVCDSSDNKIYKPDTVLRANAPSFSPNCAETNFTAQYGNHPSPENTYQQIDAVVRQLRKPLPEIEKFDGNPLEYQRFMRQFYTKIIVNSESDIEKLNYLQQYTTGEAYKIVKSFGCYMDAATGYRLALNQLEKRYGNNEVLANAFIKRALDWPTIKPDSPKMLDDFGIFLLECENAIHCIEAVKVLEYPDNLKKLVGKLPYFFHDKWRNIVHRNREIGQQTLFSQLVTFVTNESQKANDPTYGREAMRFDSRDQTVIKKNKSFNRAYATAISESPTAKTAFTPNSTEVKTAFTSPCLYCTIKGHSLHVCRKLKTLPYEEKMHIIQTNRLCFGCLQKGHRSRDCSNKLTCDQCNRRHPTICHVDGPVPRLYPKDKVNTETGNTDVKTIASAFSTLDGCRDKGAGIEDCTMAIVPVTVKMKNGIKAVQTYAFLDPGSTATFCTESLINRIGGTGKRVKITLDTMGSPYTMETTAVNGLLISDLDHANFIELPKVYTKQTMPVTTEHMPTTKDLQQWPHLSGIDIPKIDGSVELLIGNNVPDAYTPQDIKTGPRGSPHATKSILGWIAWNIVRPDSTDFYSANSVCVNRTAISAVEELEHLSRLERQLKVTTELDFPERIIDDKKESSIDDKKFLSKVNNSITLSDGHYYIKLPFKTDDVKLPNNEQLAKQRLRGLKSKMEKNPKFCDDYKTFMANILEKGYAETVPLSELQRNDGKVWYIPHHGVYHPQKQKIRVVFDCAATYQGVSLNNCLLQGPDLTNNLLSVLLRFRQERVAITGDIEAMFFQVKVPKDDCDCLRFLWWPGGDFTKNPIAYRMTVHLFGASSSPSCSNSALLKTVDDNADRFSIEAANVIRNHFYVDDCVTSTDSEATAIRLIDDVTELCQQGGFRVTKWNSNSRAVIESVNETDRANEVKNLNFDHDSLPSDRVLGIYWSPENDTFGFDVKLRDKPLTKRGILSITSSIYDPLGLASPFILKARIILQELFRLRVGWDDSIPVTIADSWQQWVSELPQLRNLQLERCYKPSDFTEIVSYQLHVFTDASEVGYGISIYLRLTDSNARTHSILVLGKSRVAPLKKITIPRLELSAATVGVRLARMVLREIGYPIDSVHYWTDSMSVIRYICNESTRFQTFVSNRLAVIRDGSEPQQWNYVESSLNPADCASRGVNLDKFLDNQTWFHGPNFLLKPETEWPRIDNQMGNVPSDDPEVKKATVTSTVVKSYNSPIDLLINRYSDWLKLRRVTALTLLAVQKFKRTLTTPATKPPNLDKTTTLLTTEDLQEAEILLIKHVQGQYFDKEIANLSKSEESRQLPKGSPLRKLDPILVNGVLRVGGRLERAHIPFDSKHQIILPKDSYLSQLYLEYIHRKVGHLGRNSILASVRERFWITGASTAIKKLLSRCVICRKYQARSTEQKMADLPKERLATGQGAFQSVGMDYFGPFEVKRARSTLKRYGVVFTCLSSRAVHLELATSLTTDSCINAIRRFISRRGPVQVIRSDNGTNLVGSKRELREEIQNWNQTKINKTLQQNNITWIFNPPAASHHGGVWERLIRTIRKILYSLLKQQNIYLDDESLATLFCEVEAILNGRPLTDVPSDHSDLEALTPNHLLLLRTGEKLPPGHFNKTDNYVKQRWRQVQYLADVFWKRWTSEYLPLLQLRQKWTKPRRNLTVNDLVLVVDNTPRNCWCLGRVVEVFKDSKGAVRSVKVKTKSTCLVRPISKLCLILEAQDDSLVQSD